MSNLPLFGEPTRASDDGDGGDEEKVYRVSQLNRVVKTLLEDRFRNVWVEGELSDVTRAASGHVYFTLNDESEPAQVRVVMFKNDARRSKAKLEDGARVKLQGQLSLFTPRGSFQLIARVALPFGLGELHAQFERVRQRLQADGLLDAARKRPLPKLPRVLGVVTSAHGAALHDIVRVAQERCPVRIVVAPCLVQGAQAPGSIVAALSLIQKLPALDVVIVGRGGGAAEDLLAFNDEGVGRALAAVRVPTVSAVGHEVDVSITDLVADVRAATPSNAAELVVPERRVLLASLRDAERALARLIELRIGRERLLIERFDKALEVPQVEAARQRLSRLHERLARRDPRRLLAGSRTALATQRARLLATAQALPRRHRGALAERVARLSALSPLAVLARGYAIALHEPTGKALLHARDANNGDRLQVRLHDGTLVTRVEQP